MYKLFLAIRYLRKRRIAYVAIGAAMLCTAMVLIVMSVMGGFLDTLKVKARGLLGDLVVDNRAYQGFPLYQEFIDEIKQWPEIVEATPVIYTYGLLHFPHTEQTNLVSVIGLRLEEAYRVNAFEKSLFYNTYYPETTHLGEQQQAMLGVDFDAEPVPPKIDEPGLDAVRPPRLPEPHYSAFERYCAAYESENEGKSFSGDPETVDTPMNEDLRKYPITPLPGVFGFNAADGMPGYSGNRYPGLIIGRDIIAKREADGRYRRRSAYPLGCEVLVSMLRREFDPTPIKQPFRYADDSRTGIYDIDSRHVYCDFELLQKLVRMDAAEYVDGSVAPARCSQIQVKIAEGGDAYELADRLERQYHKLAADRRLDATDQHLIGLIDVLTWEESQSHIIGPVEKERRLVTSLFVIISLVAVALVLCILYMIVLQKTRDIGIVKSIGGSSAGVAQIFILYGAAIGIVGGLLGTVVAYFFVSFINETQAVLVEMNPAWQVWDRSVYSFDEIPNTVRTADIIVVFVAAVITSTVGAFAAAWRAGAMHPVEALRYE